MLNRIIIQGRMTKDIEMRSTQSGKHVGSFSVAVERDFKDKQTGEKPVDFIDVTAWGGTADLVEKWMGKGRMVVIEGKLQTRTYEDKNGNKRKATEILAESVYFGDSKRGNEESYPVPNKEEDSGCEESGGEAQELPF